jgi:D-3-phosphoglycerate dehydrogenase
VAELAFGLIIALDRRIPENVMELRRGKWNKKEFSKAEGLFGKTPGIIGVGRIGRELIPRSKAFGMKVIAWSRSLTPQKAEELDIGYCASPLEVALQADIVSVHLALTPETKNFIRLTLS